MTPLTEIIYAFRLKANTHYNPSMDGTRDAYMEGRKEAYLDCANILEKWRNSIDEDKLDEFAEDYAIGESDNCAECLVLKDAYKAGYRKAMEV